VDDPGGNSSPFEKKGKPHHHPTIHLKRLLCAIQRKN